MASEIYEPDNLIADSSFPITTEVVIIKADQVLKRGSVLGKDDDGKYVLSLSTAEDGSENPTRVLSEDIDTAGADSGAVVFKSGVFNANAMTFGAEHTADSIKDVMWTQGIEIKTNSVTA
jgi:hypothetical protein